MKGCPSILCPIDYSEASVAALRYAAALAEHFVTRSIVLNVEDPLFPSAMSLGTGAPWTREMSEAEVAKFVSDVFDGDRGKLALYDYEVAVGKPSIEILRAARERTCDLIVMSSHGLTGPRRMFFGSTTERVLRETAVPVLVTPPIDPGPVHIETAERVLGPIVVPLDLSTASRYQTQVAEGIAAALNLPIVFVHVIGPRMGSVTYRMLCLAPMLVLALPTRLAVPATGHIAVTTESREALA